MRSGVQRRSVNSPPSSLHAGAARTAVLTAGAMLAFAANSLFCRLALGQQVIDPASFAAMRVLTAALTLAVIVLPRWRARGRTPGNWRAAAALFAYLVGFSFAYRSISAGTGALILFGAAQLTMIGAALRAGEAFPPRARLGFALAVVGLVVLVSPGVTAPDPIGALLMGVAGLAWGVYSLLGRKAGDPLEATANNFIYLLPLAIGLCLVSPSPLEVSWRGVALATASGAIASGLGYVVWYQAVQRLSALHAATVQLSVPVIAAVGGVILLAEHITLRLVLASVATLGGIATVLAARVASGRTR
jgi:drug/metabolite transporter (DMT)-like permease